MIREPHPDDVGDEVNDDDVDDGGGSNNEDDDLDEDDGAASPPPDAVYEEEEDEDEPNGGGGGEDGDADRVGSAHDPSAAAADGGDIAEDQVFHHSDDHPSAPDIFGKKHRPLVRKLYPDITGLVINHSFLLFAFGLGNDFIKNQEMWPKNSTLEKQGPQYLPL